MDIKLQQAQGLVRDLVDLVSEDRAFAEYIIDEYVYLCDNNRVKELRLEVDSILEE